MQSSPSANPIAATIDKGLLSSVANWEVGVQETFVQKCQKLTIFNG